MNRWLWMASIAMVLTTTTGCLRHHTRGDCQPGHCNACSSCNACGSCGNGQGGLLSGLAGGCGRTGCTPGPIGWQQGGLNYSGHLCPPHGGTAGHPGHLGIGQANHGNPYGQAPGAPGVRHGGLHGALGHGGMGAALMPGHAAAQQLQSQPFNPGPPTGTVTYPYYTHRGPRDFLLDNPPTIGR